MVSAENGPRRTCVACRQTKDKNQLVRYVVAPDGAVLVDYRQRLPGRGAYTCIDMQCLRNAIEKNGFQRSFRGLYQSVDLVVLTEQLIKEVEQKIANLIGISRKSSQCISGSNAVIKALRKGSSLALILIAEDISMMIGNKIKSLAERQNIYSVQLYDKKRIGQLLGKEERSVIAVQTGSLSESLLNELHRYTQLLREN
jgi:predicted RNA-binding protein YlxR (DUF448 family)